MAPQLNIIAHFAVIKIPGYTMDFFLQFDAVIMELDNAETRSYVNKVCQALLIFIVDAGSMRFKEYANGYSEGTVSCTIRSQPSNCTHCVIWAIYLFSQLFSGKVGIFVVKGFDQNQPNSVFNKFFKGEEMINSIDIIQNNMNLLRSIILQREKNLLRNYKACGFMHIINSIIWIIVI
ncbi:unnamed protein product [Paramecium pentaurelia]|nr:unnamed protein product [Paramecium pentaurelia]